MDQKRKRLLKRSIIFIVLAGVLYTCKVPLPYFVVSPYDVYHMSSERAIKKERSVWHYYPLKDTLVIQDSIRNIHFKVQEAFVHAPSRVYQTYLWFFVPWVKVYNSEEYYFFTARFDFMSLEQITDRGYGIWYEVGEREHDQIFRGGPMHWDEEKQGYSFYGERLSQPLPDTLYFTVYGRDNVFMRKDEYYSKNEQAERIRIYDYSHKQEVITLGVLPFIKGDSIIFNNKKEEENRPAWSIW